MSSWSTYYSAVGGSGKLSRIIKETRQRQILAESTISDELPDPEKLSISRSWNSLTGVRDDLSGGISRNQSDTWELPLEPYPNLKLWLKFESGLSLKDWSHNKNVTKVKSFNPARPLKSVQPIKRLAKDDFITEGRIYSIFDGTTQWTEVEDSADIRFSDLLMSNNEVCLSIYLSPFGNVTFDTNQEYTDLFYKVDSDQIDYAYRVRISKNGALRFTVVDNHAVYDLETAENVVPVYDLGDFDSEDFDIEDFEHEGDTPHQVDPDVEPDDWKIYSFAYSVLTHSMKIYSAHEEPETAIKTVVLHAQTSNPLNDSNLSLFLPCLEGNGTMLHDASGQGNHAAFDETNPPAWVDDGDGNKLLTFSADNQSAVIPHDVSLDAFSTFTIAFKFRLYQYSQSSEKDNLLMKGYGGGSGIAGSTNGSFRVFMEGNGIDNLICQLKNDAGVTRFLDLIDVIDLDTWYDVIITYDGTDYTIQIPGVETFSLNAPGDTFTNSGDIWLGSSDHCFHGELSTLQVYKGRVWGQSDIDYFADVSPTEKGDFPVWEPLPPEEPEEPQETTKELVQVYDVPNASGALFQLNNPAATSPFESFYDVAGGVATEDPEVMKINIADGEDTEEEQTTETDHPFESEYSLSPQSSKGEIDNDQDGDIFYGQQIMSTGSDMYNEYIGKIQCYIGEEGDTGGSVAIGVMKENGSFIQFGNSISVSNLPSGDYQSYTRENSTNANPDTGYQMKVGDAVGVKWFNPSGSGTIIVQRGGGGNHYEGSNSDQGVYNGSWKNHSTYSMAGQVWSGGYTTSETTVVGTPAFHVMDQTFWRVGDYQANSTVEGIIITRKVWRVRRKGTLSSATLRCVIRDTNDSTVATLGSTVACSGISTTTQDLEFEQRDNAIAWADGYRVCLEYVNMSGVDSSNCIEVNFNPSGVEGSAIKAQYFEDVFWFSDVWNDLGSGYDWAGQTYTGGNSFDPWIALDNTRERFGTQINDTGDPDPIAQGKKITKVTATLKSIGTPDGPITFKIYSGDTAVASSFSTVQASSVGASETSFDFTWVFNAHVTSNNNRLVVEFTSGTADDYIMVKLNTDAEAGASGDGQKMIAVEYVNNTWNTLTNLDFAGIMYTGGTPDLTSKSRIAIEARNLQSLLKSEKITEARFQLAKKGAPTGQVDIVSRRGSDDTIIDILGFKLTSELSTTVWTETIVINRDAIHFLGVTDKISIEYEAGDTSNAVYVLLNTSFDFDGDNTRAVAFDSVNWEEVEDKEIIGELWTGGYLYTPDPGTPFVLPPDAYSHNLFIGAGPGVSSLSPSDKPSAYAGMRIREFRIVAGEEYDITDLTNWIDNKHTILPVPKGRTALGGYTTLKAVQ